MLEKPRSKPAISAANDATRRPTSRRATKFPNARIAGIPASTRDETSLSSRGFWFAPVLRATLAGERYGTRVCRHVQRGACWRARGALSHAAVRIADVRSSSCGRQAAPSWQSVSALLADLPHRPISLVVLLIYLGIAVLLFGSRRPADAAGRRGVLRVRGWRA